MTQTIKLAAAFALGLAIPAAGLMGTMIGNG
jgi:hypothetical protein